MDSNYESCSPAEWTVGDIEQWSKTINLPPAARSALVENEIDGVVLLTLSKSDLREELLITSLAVRRYLWDAIERLRSQQILSDHSAAVELHSEEIETFVHAPENHVLDPFIIQALRSDVEKERLAISDHEVARNLQGEGSSLRVYQDAEVAKEEQRLLDEHRLREQYDHAYALSLSRGASRRRRPPTFGDETDDGTVKSLMSLCINTCVQNRINVAEALQAGTVTVPQRRDRFVEESPAPGIGVEETKELDEPEEIKLATIPRCSVCYENNLPGFDLPCVHSTCKQCMAGLMRTAIGDASLLPLKCCEIPIDMNISSLCLKRRDRDKFLCRVIENEAENKMHCPKCSAFINLDLIDTEEVTEILCDCNQELCTVCKSVAHPSLSCEQNMAKASKADEVTLALSRDMGWKQCPGCNFIIELHTGCNHITCINCKAEFCYQCRLPWDSRSGDCSSGRCSRWEEANLIEAGEARVQAQEQALGRAYEPEERANVRARVMRELNDNETCDHVWERQSMFGECERCGFSLYVYGMVCVGDCGSTVCYTCANFRIPRRGWR